MTAVPLTLIGGPTVLIEYAGLRILTDPTFDPAGSHGKLVKLAGPAIGREDIEPVDVVLLSHDEHPDNLDTSGRMMLGSVRHVLSTPSAQKRITGVQGMEKWDEAILPMGETPVTITAVPARHGPRAFAPAMTGEVTGFMLTADGWPTVYISGDNSSVSKARKIAKRLPPVDIAIIHAGGASVPARYGDALLTADAERSARIAALWPDAVVVPVHIDDWAHFSQPREDFLREYARHGNPARLRVIERGERRTVDTLGQ